MGPRWSGGNHNEPKLLYSAYKQALILAKENNLHSIGFPLISAGIFGYPVDKAWRKAIQACNDFIQNNPEYDTKIIFAVLDDKILATGEEKLKESLKFDYMHRRYVVVDQDNRTIFVIKKWSSCYMGDNDYTGDAIPLYSGVQIYATCEVLNTIKTKIDGLSRRIFVESFSQNY